MIDSRAFPIQFRRSDSIPLILSNGNEVSIPSVQIQFDHWRGEIPKDTYGKKQILNYRGDKFFAELLILEFFKENGWEGVWVDTYRRRYVSSYWPLKTKPLPPKQKIYLEEIYRIKGSRSGCFDVYCWKQDSLVFAESKRRGLDHIRKSQKEWISAALQTGITELDLLIVEWTLAD